MKGRLMLGVDDARMDDEVQRRILRFEEMHRRAVPWWFAR